MKNQLIMTGAAVLAAVVLMGPANAEPYFELNGGPTFASAKVSATGLGSTSVGTSTGYNVGGGFGTTLNFLPPAWTLGAQVLYTTQGVSSIGGISVSAPGSSTNNSTLSVMGVVNYHLHTRWRLGLYLGAGLGMVQKDLSASAAGTTITLSDREFGWQGQAGMEYPISANTNLFAEYRYQGSSAWKINFPAGLGLPAGGLSISEATNNVTFGVRIAL